VCEITSEVFQASDLAGAKRREFLGAAREGGALLRDTDGFALTMIPLAQLEAITEVAPDATPWPMSAEPTTGLLRPHLALREHPVMPPSGPNPWLRLRAVNGIWSERLVTWWSGVFAECHRSRTEARVAQELVHETGGPADAGPVVVPQRR
jgi:hypothetical protein